MTLSVSDRLFWRRDECRRMFWVSNCVTAIVDFNFLVAEVVIQMAAHFDSLATYEDARRFVLKDEAMDAAVDRVSKIDFTMQSRKLIAESGWTAESCAEAEDLYRKYLAMNIRYPNRKLCPNGPVDEFWHAHILDTRKYLADCEDLFGEMLHHYPYFGMRGPEDKANLDHAFADTVDLYIRHFGVDPTAGDAHARSCSPQRCP